jgi:ankyrin repeat protein
MYAALYGDADSVRFLLDRGADPNARNDAKATALMFATDDAAKTRLLLNRGADANARSDDGQTPLLIAAARPGAIQVARLLLDHGANPSATTVVGATTPVLFAAGNGDAGLMKLLMDRGAALHPSTLGPAVRSECDTCIDLVIASVGPSDLAAALPNAIRAGNLAIARMLLDRGARSTDDVLRAVAQSPDDFPVDFIERLIQSGADIHAETPLGPILHLARLQGDTPLSRSLTRAGAKSVDLQAESASSRPQPARSVRAAIERSLLLIDRADVAFISESGCISCHNNSLPPMVRAAARKSGIPINEQIASSQRESIVRILADNRERVLQMLGVPGRQDAAGYILLGLAAENYRPDEVTDAWARYLKNLQQTDGRWRVQAQRPPIESSDIQVTAAALRAIQVYAPPTRRNDYQRAVQLAARWLAEATPKTTEDRVFLMLGLHWAGSRQDVIRRVAKELLAQQRPDGGWSQLFTLTSDAYATGQVLFALSESGSLKTTDPVYQRGVKFLMDTQFEDGSWRVRTRTLPVQPYFESDFPHRQDQFVSAAATNWATMGLLNAAR